MKPKNTNLTEDEIDPNDELAEYTDDLADFDDSWFGDQQLEEGWDDGLIDEDFDDEY